LTNFTKICQRVSSFMLPIPASVHCTDL